MKGPFPFLLLFNLPGSLLTFPAGSTIILEVEIGIKTVGDHLFEFIDVKPHDFRENQKTKVVVAKKFDMESTSLTTQTRLQCKRD